MGGAFARGRVRRHRRLWIDAARARDLPSRLVGEAGLQITLNHGEAGERLVLDVSDSGYTLDEATAVGDSDTETLIYDLIAEAGVPVVPYRPFTIATLSAAARFLDGAPGSCVVKPLEESVLRIGATSDVRDARALRITAATAAAAVVAGEVRDGRGRSRSRLGRLVAGLRDLSGVPLVIRHKVPGEVYRLLYLDGELIDAVQRTGGMAASGEVCRPARHLVGPSIVELGARAAAVVGDRLIGVDVVTGQGPDHPSGCVLEIDRIPRLGLHDHGMPGAVDAARLVLEKLAQG